MAAARAWLIATPLVGFVPTKAGAVAVRVVAVVGLAAVVVVVVCVTVAVVLAVFRAVLVVVLLVVEELVACVVALEVMLVVALAEEDWVVVVEAGLPEPQAASTAATAVPRQSAVAVGRSFIGGC
jgi:hypothetical protein